MMTFHFYFDNYHIWFFRCPKIDTNQTNSSRERRSNRDVRVERGLRVERGIPDGWGKLWYTPNQFLICRFPSFAQKCVRQKYELSCILKILRAKIRFFTRMVTTHKSPKKKCELTFSKFQAYIYVTRSLIWHRCHSCTLRRYRVMTSQHRQRLYEHPVHVIPTLYKCKLLEMRGKWHFSYERIRRHLLGQYNGLFNGILARHGGRWSGTGGDVVCTSGSLNTVRIHMYVFHVLCTHSI
jgi:hypothetical protein